MMQISANGVTPIDVAAKNKSHQAAIFLIDQFYSRKDFIAKIFEKPIKDTDTNKVAP
jgi:hypothetical protein